ncbi:hypothetical protein KDK_02420 [Dictyobacter kobayashii]|uniref:Histone deacetylase domain-containing protein n=2 Tax=Dictyobacter kobayashii TaxID=2014872 RepID=A0A402ABH5_9CHLR|nr:hypothetical protein KDK_02420 [Dictyobacter kobayashii]
MDGYRELTALMVELADKVCEGRLVILQEGGYSISYAPYCSVAIAEALLGTNVGIVDLYDNAPELRRSQTIFSHDTQQALREAHTHYQRWWQL